MNKFTKMIPNKSHSSVSSCFECVSQEALHVLARRSAPPALPGPSLSGPYVKCSHLSPLQRKFNFLLVKWGRLHLLSPPAQNLSHTIPRGWP